PRFVQEGQLSARLRDRSFEQHCNLLLDRCSRLLASEQNHRGHLVPAMLAALVAADGSAVPLPLRSFQAAAEAEDYQRLLQIIRRLAMQIDEPGYDTLLAALDQAPPSRNEWEFGSLINLLNRAKTPADAFWAYELNLEYYLEQSCLRLAEVRS